jgi:uncharacterized protein YnzC (UPF0291/DUF896 family)
MKPRVSDRGLARAAAVAAGLAIFATPGAAYLRAQKLSPAEIAEKMSGTWNLNRELSPGFSSPPGRGQGRQSGGPSFALAGAVPQRGGGGRGGGGGLGGDLPNTNADLTPEELAAQAAIRQLQMIAPTITIKATADNVTFVDQRGEQSFAIDGKSSKMDVNNAHIDVKNRWDKQVLRQEFSNPKTKLHRSWEIDGNGRLVMKARIESMTLNSTEVKAVFDRQ